MVSERLKQISYDRSFVNLWFWRTQQQKEIDLIEEADGMLTAVECKWNPGKANVKAPKMFTETYRPATFKVVTPANAAEYLLGPL